MAIDVGPGPSVGKAEVTTTSTRPLPFTVPPGVRSVAGWPTAHGREMVLLEIHHDQVTDGSSGVSLQSNQGQAKETKASWLDAARTELSKLASEAAHPGWDGGKELPLSVDVHETADLLVALLAGLVPRPELGVGRKGQVTLDWWGTNDRTMTAEVHTAGRIIFATSGDDFPLRGAVQLSHDAREVPPALLLGIRQVLNDFHTRSL